MTLYAPPTSVGIQEHHQIEKRLDVWAKALAVTLPTQFSSKVLLTWWHPGLVFRPPTLVKPSQAILGYTLDLCLS